MENPKRPQVLKGALVQFGRGLPQHGRTIAFQYNPESLRRTLEPAGPGEAPKVEAAPEPEAAPAE